MTHASRGACSADIVILDRYFLDSDDCDPAYRGMGRFMRNMREAGFGALRRDSDILSVDSITGFTRFHYELCDYVETILAKNPQHLFSVEHGLSLIGASNWVKCVEALKNVGLSLGSTRAFVQAASNEDHRILQIEKQMRSLDLKKLATRKAGWLKSRSETMVVPHDKYRMVLQDHTMQLRRRAE